jgi:hypothetical protein
MSDRFPGKAPRATARVLGHCALAHRTRGALLAAAVLGSTFVSSPARSDSAVTKPYALTTGSTFSQGCFPPCLCPVFISNDVRGTFNLTPLPVGAPFEVFSVTDVNWRVKIGERDIPITGSGTYMRIGFQHRLELDLAIDNEAPRHFDSGLVAGGAEFPNIDSTISLHGQERSGGDRGTDRGRRV